VLLEKWLVNCLMINSDELVGPRPTIYSPEPESTQAAFNFNPSRPVGGLLKILRSLIGHEHISLEAARDLINNPREGSCTFPFKKAKGKKGGGSPRFRNRISSIGQVAVYAIHVLILSLKV
jgi:hypothetical protein